VSTITPQHRWVIGCVGLLLPSWTAPAPLSGQATPRDTIPPVQLAPVVISVLRGERPADRVPYAVSVSGDSIVQRGAPRLALGEALAAVPGIDVQDRFNSAVGDRVSIRGFGARTQFGIRGVKILVDGVPATMADGQTTLDHLDLGSVQRVEAIRGAASAAYGNASGGVLQFETARPATHPLVQELETVIGSDGLVRLQSSTTARTGPTTFGLDVSRFRYGGYREHSDADKVFATWHLRYDSDRDRLRFVANVVDLDARNPGSVSDSSFQADPTAANPLNAIQQTGKDARQGQVGISWRRSTATGSVEASAYGILRSLSNPIPVSVVELRRKAGGAHIQVQRTLSGGRRSLRWLAGVEIDVQDDERRNYDNDAGSKGALTLDQHERVWNFSPFTQIEATVTDRVSLIAGLRYDRLRFEATDHFTADGRDDSGTRTMAAVSPSAGISLSLGEPAILYANVATAFESPTTTELGNRPDGTGGFNQTLQPQRTLSYELGLRGRLGRVATYDAAAFRAHVTDQLIPFEVATDPGRTFYRNAGSATHRGVEASAAITPWPGTTLRGAYTYLSATFDDYVTADGPLDGNRVPGTAPQRLQIVAAYDSPHRWYVTAQTVVVDDTPADDGNDAYAAGYMLLHLRAGIRDIDLRTWSVSPFAGISNVLSAHYVSAVAVNAFGGRYYEPGPGREVWLGVTVRFAVRR